MRVEHFVEYIYPGMFVSEMSVMPIPKRERATLDIPKGAFGFRYFDERVYEAQREDGAKFEQREPRENVSPWTYFGDTWTLAHVETLAKQDEKRWHTLLSNMRGNGYARIVRTAAGQCIPLDNHDVVEPTR